MSRYRLRKSGVVIHLRHGTPDINTFEEVFHQRQYELPAEVDIELGALDEPLRVADLGANVGLFGAYVLGRFPDASIIGFEPDPSNAEVLGRSIEANQDRGRWALVEACASNRAGETEFAVGRFACSAKPAPGESGDGDLIRVPEVDVFPYLEDTHLIKMDIEGGEWEILGDPRFSSVPARAIVMEYHQRFCPGPDARVTATGLLEGAGYTVRPTFQTPEFGTGGLWAWRTVMDV